MIPYERLSPLLQKIYQKYCKRKAESEKLQSDLQKEKGLELLAKDLETNKKRWQALQGAIQKTESQLQTEGRSDKLIQSYTPILLFEKGQEMTRTDEMLLLLMRVQGESLWESQKAAVRWPILKKEKREGVYSINMLNGDDTLFTIKEVGDNRLGLKMRCGGFIFAERIGAFLESLELGSKMNFKFVKVNEDQ